MAELPEGISIHELRTFRRTKWRRNEGEKNLARCMVCGLPIHRTGTYYVRPAYTDGIRWICSRDFRRLRRAFGESDSNSYRSTD